VKILDTLPVTLDDVLEAQKLLDGIIARTPVESSRALGSMVGGDVYFKCENLQRAGSFKVRGAYVRMARLSAEEKKRGVVAASAGNHAQGVAVAAKSLGIKARIYMPLGVALPKLAATRSHGAEVILHGHNVDEALAEAQRYSNETGMVFVHPFDNVDVVAGQGTVGLEILEQVPNVDTVLMGVGGGGLLAGVAVARCGPPAPDPGDHRQALQRIGHGLFETHCTSFVSCGLRDVGRGFVRAHRSPPAGVS